MNEIKILVCAHKDVSLPEHPHFLPIQAGAACHDHIEGFTPDDTGDNISLRNPNWCELTAHYWAWKNLPSCVQTVGLCHYRRFFDFSRKWPFFSPDRSFCPLRDFMSSGYMIPDVNGMLKGCDIILPKTRHYPYSCTEQYGRWHRSEDWELLRKVIAEKTPDYLPAFEKTMDCRNGYSGYNMFICNRKWFDLYSEWLFKILFEVEARVVIPLDPVQSRIFGYMSERLINVFAARHCLRVKHVPLIMPIDEEFVNPTNLRYTLWRLRDDVKFCCKRLPKLAKAQ